MKVSALTPDQWNTLKQYRLNKDPLPAYQGIQVSSFFQEDEMERFLTDRLKSMGTDNRMVAASLFMKRYAFVAAMGLYSMTYWNRKLNLAPDNLIMVDGEKNGLWIPQFYLKDSTVYEFTSPEEKQTYIKSLFSDHLNKIMDSLKKPAKLILWENIAVYIFWVYENDDFLPNEEMRGKREEDFRQLLLDENSHWFGQYHRNPLSRYYSPKKNEELRVRKTCCFSYRLENGEQYRCKTCPQTCRVKS
ncbi:(2Fe-2S)-binding protein [Rossellomorea aquimaris]|uniref:(2Fe-2S)-binding protein n=1 Tax=Rossellomorea aquimaris TaxID=189382 RepID=UPI0007D07FC1|nr:IucA/IucC family C-terminal-domain containing protein [Rossellomorea aquimaris]